MYKPWILIYGRGQQLKSRTIYKMCHVIDGKLYIMDAVWKKHHWVSSVLEIQRKGKRGVACSLAVIYQWHYSFCLVSDFCHFPASYTRRHDNNNSYITHPFFRCSRNPWDMGWSDSIDKRMDEGVGGSPTDIPSIISVFSRGRLRLKETSQWRMLTNVQVVSPPGVTTMTCSKKERQKRWRLGGRFFSSWGKREREEERVIFFYQF